MALLLQLARKVKGQGSKTAKCLSEGATERSPSFIISTRTHVFVKEYITYPFMPTLSPRTCICTTVCLSEAYYFGRHLWAMCTCLQNVSIVTQVTKNCVERQMALLYPTMDTTSTFSEIILKWQGRTKKEQNKTRNLRAWEKLLLILILDTRGGKTPVPIGQEAGWDPEPVSTQKLQEKSLPLLGIEVGHYTDWLSYPGSLAKYSHITLCIYFPTCLFQNGVI